MKLMLTGKSFVTWCLTHPPTREPTNSVSPTSVKSSPALLAYQPGLFSVGALEKEHPSFIEVAPSVRCKDFNHLEVFLQDVIDQGGEGVILRDPSSPYQPGRSLGFLKHKVSRYAS